MDQGQAAGGRWGAGALMAALESYLRIDAIRSVSAMRSALERLPDEDRQEVFALARKHSRFRFTWPCLEELLAAQSSETV